MVRDRILCWEVYLHDASGAYAKDPTPANERRVLRCARLLGRAYGDLDPLIADEYRPRPALTVVARNEEGDR